MDNANSTLEAIVDSMLFTEADGECKAAVESDTSEGSKVAIESNSAEICDVSATTQIETIRAKRAAFSAKLVPTVEPSRFYGLSMAQVRRIARDLYAGKLAIPWEQYSTALPHPYVEFDQIHMICLNEIENPDLWAVQMENFLPYVDNWMVTDACSPKIFRMKRRDQLDQTIQQFTQAAQIWLLASETYTVRTGVIVLLEALQKGHFEQWQAQAVAQVRHENYYVHMAVGWYYATLFEKFPEIARPLLEADTKVLQIESHALAIRKIIESRRTSAENLAWAKSVRQALKIHQLGE